MSDRPRVAVLAGGFSLEREASLLSGHHVRNSLQDRGYHAEILEPDQSMFTRVADFDLAFLVVHGRLGEDGTIQSMLDLAGVPYTGATGSPSALAWNKPVAKGLLAQAGIHTPKSVLFSTAAFRELGASNVVHHLGDAFDFPLVVKPAMGGSALGVSRVDTPDDLSGALMHAMAYAELVIAEQFVDGVEVAVSILDGDVLPVAEIEPQTELYDYAARYTAGATDYFIPARLDDSVLTEAARVARQTWDALGARHLGRVDMIVAADGTPWVLELATCPGLTPTSVFPMSAEAAGIQFGGAVERILHAALRDAGT